MESFGCRKITAKPTLEHNNKKSDAVDSDTIRSKSALAVQESKKKSCSTTEQDF